MSEAQKEFTVKVPRWSPYIAPVRLDDATPEQLDAMKVTPSNLKVSEYVLTLAHDPESLAVRSPLFNAIMYGKNGLPSSDRELAAVAASIVNRCVYCAAVHGSRFNGLTKRGDVIDAVFAHGANAEIDARAKAIVTFATNMSSTPSQATAEDVATLRALGFTDLDLLDLTLSAAIFGWANRLMHTLGEPI